MLQVWCLVAYIDHSCNCNKSQVWVHKQEKERKTSMRNSRQQEGCKNMHKEKLGCLQHIARWLLLFLLHSLLQQGLLLKQGSTNCTKWRRKDDHHLAMCCCKLLSFSFSMTSHLSCRLEFLVLVFFWIITERKKAVVQTFAMLLLLAACRSRRIGYSKRSRKSIPTLERTSKHRMKLIIVDS